MAKVITKEALDAATEKAADKATKAETKRCIAAVKSVDLADVTKPSVAIRNAVAAIKAQ